MSNLSDRITKLEQLLIDPHHGDMAAFAGEYVGADPAHAALVAELADENQTRDFGLLLKLDRRLRDSVATWCARPDGKIIVMPSANIIKKLGLPGEPRVRIVPRPERDPETGASFLQIVTTRPQTPAQPGKESHEYSS